MQRRKVEKTTPTPEPERWGWYDRDNRRDSGGPFETEAAARDDARRWQQETGAPRDPVIRGMVGPHLPTLVGRTVRAYDVIEDIDIAATDAGFANRHKAGRQVSGDGGPKDESA